MDKKKKKKEKIVQAVKNIPTIADQEQWVLTLDKEEGTLFYSPEIIPDNAELHQVTDEYALYTDTNFKPLGVMVECYNANFVKHHDLFEKLSKDIFGGNEKIKTLSPEKSKERKKDIIFLKSLLERTLIVEADTKLIPA